MKLKDALWKNWSTWAQGGLDNTTIQRELEPESVDELLNWVHVDIPHLDQSQLKRTLDLGSWCLYGTHTLPYLDRQMRDDRVKEASQIIGLESSVVQRCLARVHDLPAEI